MSDSSNEERRKTIPKPSDKLTIRTASETIGVSRQAVERFIQQRRLPATRVNQGSFSFWLIRRGDLDHYVANRRTAFSQLPPDYVNTNDPDALRAAHEQAEVFPE